MKWYEDFDIFLHQFEINQERMDETAFYFKTDPDEIDHYIGYVAGYKKPYWTGLCDIQDGCEFSTAREMLEAPIYNGQSIKNRWAEVCIYQIGGISAEEWEKT